MNTAVKSSVYFLKQLKRLSKKYPSVKQDVEDLRKVLLKNPRMGDDLGKGVYKIRLKIESKGKGKSGGARVISYVETEVIGIVQNNMVRLIDIYDKSEMDSISKQEIEELLKSVKFES